MNVHAVVMAGGSGTRLWPVSTPEKPKQFLALFADRTLFELAVDRGVAIAGAHRCWIVTERRYEGRVRALVGRAVGNLLIEPVAGGTLGAVGLAATAIAAEDEDAVLAVLPSDHLCPDVSALASTIRLLASTIRGGEIGVVGTVTDRVTSDFGYIRPGDLISESHDLQISAVQSYAEKPQRPETFDPSGWLLNMGVVVVSCRTLAATLDIGQWSVGQRPGDGIASAKPLRPSPARFEDVVLAGGCKSVVARADIAWADMGTWPSLAAAAPRDDNGNQVTGPAEIIDSEDCLVVSVGRPVKVMGMTGMAVVVGPTDSVICNRSAIDSIASGGGATR